MPGVWEEGWEDEARHQLTALRLKFNSSRTPQNYIHCKLYNIKVPMQDMKRTTPVGGGGLKYSACPNSFVLHFLSRLVDFRLPQKLTPFSAFLWLSPNSSPTVT
ncbi:hypothetical protein K438DRAFT_248516 [Mycena galopus ATCC 62051]|nr:hypothetical protein K438DRAFT_248516 [Mycena galopus ATCC 62051]